MEEIIKLQKLLKFYKRVVFFGGAGVSTESGIPDFRSVDGLYHQKYSVSPEVILSHTYYRRHPDEFFHFYKEKMLCLDAHPNMAHKKLAQWEEMGIVSAVVTQNIDGLHQKAGSKVVWELHGSTLRNYCERCHRFYDVEFMLQSEGVPICECGGRVKPDVVLYEEGLNQEVAMGAINSIAQADLLIVGGTSLVVYPAAGMLDYFHGEKLVLINKEPTGKDSIADLIIRKPIGEVFGSINI